MRITALLHTLFMANLVGLLFPVIYLARQYRANPEPGIRSAVAGTMTRIAHTAYALVLLIVLTGVARVAESQYPWFAFESMFWLAAKQTAGLLMAVFVLGTWIPMRKAANSLRAETAANLGPNADRTFGKLKGQLHLLVGLAWVLLALAVLRP